MSDIVKNATHLSVGEMARRSGVPISTLHFYESKGLIRPTRTPTNRRVYARGMLRRVAIIKVAQRIGISLAEVGEALKAIPHDRAPTAAEWADFSAGWAGTLQARIDTLMRLKDNLTSCIGCGCLSMSQCPLRNADDHLGLTQSGPVFLERDGPEPMNEQR